jgi:hypothetical protein
MATIAEIEQLAQDLSEKDRAVLAAHLLSRWSSLINRLRAAEPDASRSTSEGLFGYRRDHGLL